MPTYDIATASFAIGAPKKWLDNLIAHHALPDVTTSGRGAQRELSFDAVVTAHIIRILSRELSISTWRAVELAVAFQQNPDQAIPLPGSLMLRLDLPTTARHIQQRLLEAAESVPRIRRGRPSARGSGTQGSG